MAIQTIGVVGAGQMGAGIAHVAAATGLKVLLADANLERAQAGKAQIEKRLARSVAKGRLEQAAADAIAARIEAIANLAPMEAADLVVEAVSENEELKNRIFSELDAVCPPSTILASNTSSIPITRMAAQTSRPEQFIGMHSS